MKHNELSQTLLYTLIVFSLFSCSRNAPEQSQAVDISKCQIIQHDLGETEICQEPQRVIALDPHMMDLLLSLGIQPIGYAEKDVALLQPFSLGAPMQVKYLGPYITDPPAYIGNRSQPSLEAIFKLEPDLILGEDTTRYDALSQIAPTVLLSGAYDDDWQDNLRTVASIFELETKAKEIINTYQERIKTTKSELTSISGQNHLLFVHTDGVIFSVFGRRSYAATILTDLGFQLVKIGMDEFPLSLEILPEIEADMIIVVASSHNTIEKERQRWEENLILRSLPAYQNQRVYFADYQLWSRIRGAIAAELIIDEVREFIQFPDHALEE